MSYILLIVMAAYNVGPQNFTLTEFQTKAACEVALKEARKFFKTVDRDSRCISVSEEVKKEKLKEELEKMP